MNTIKIFLTKDEFDADKCLRSGQCFYWQKSLDTWYGFINNNFVSLIQTDEYIEVSGNISEKDIRNYLDLDTDYNKMFDLNILDGFELQCLQTGKGIRILNQDLLETILTLTLTQRQTMTRTEKVINAVKKDYGKKVKSGKVVSYSFPEFKKIKNISLEECKSYGMGYRAKYFTGILEKIKEDPSVLEDIKSADYITAKKLLKTFPGIGNKVADCICLFALHHLEAFPIDTHIKQLMDENNIEIKKYGNYAGVMQQYMFYTKAFAEGRDNI